MNYIIITSYGEVNTTEKAVSSALSQLPKNTKLIVSDPFPETKWMLEEKFPNNKNIEYFEDPDQGKSKALNLLFQKLWSEDKNSVLILTDGDVYVSENSIGEILKKFEDPKVGCVSGRPVSINPRNDKFGYWSHFLVDVGAHEISRKKRYEKGQFLETTGYFFAFRNGVIDKIPLDVAEDTIVPYYFYKKGYKIAYAENSLVNVKWPTHFKDWMKQKKRAADSHSKLTKYAPDFPKVKSFSGEIVGGLTNLHYIFTYPKTFEEFIWTLELFPIRLYMWISLQKDLKFKKKEYKDGWREDLEVKSTRTLD
ncbi:glycosyltransferase family 2 protein [Candidatus Woesearchaeota archaeon]|nr:glycosyltransferase family 2 protein [Candidatus Woesearchaeota archaeon]